MIDPDDEPLDPLSCLLLILLWLVVSGIAIRCGILVWRWAVR